MNWARLARWRVPLGFAFGLVAVWLAEPTTRTIWAGTGLAALGQALRFWAAGHLEKAREVTSSGPYRFVRHPLYVGSALMGGGLAMAANSLLVTTLIGLYLGATLTAAVRTENAFLAGRFGHAYDRYRSGAALDTSRAFSLRRARANREYRSLLGFLAIVAILVFKASH